MPALRIDRIDLHHVAMPLISPWRTAYGEDAAIESLLCRVTSGSLDAWGESSPLAAPTYSPEWAGGIFAVARDWLAPRLVGRTLSAPADCREALSLFKGNPFAKAALDNAVWSLFSKATGTPLHRLLGAERDVVPVGADFGVMDDVSELLDHVAQAAEQRFPRVKLKFRPGWDEPVVAAVRERFPDLVVHIDCNSGYRIGDADLFRRLDRYGLAMYEQPLQHDDLVDHARLQSQVSTPVCLDESIVTVRGTEQALALGSCRYVNVKPGRVGGLTNAVEIHDRCRDAGVPAWVGGMLESAVGASQCIALAMLGNFVYPADIFPTSRFYREDLADPPVVLERDAEGLPCVRAFDRLPEPHPTRLAALTRQHAVVR